MTVNIDFPAQRKSRAPQMADSDPASQISYSAKYYDNEHEYR